MAPHVKLLDLPPDLIRRIFSKEPQSGSKVDAFTLSLRVRATSHELANIVPIHPTIDMTIANDETLIDYALKDALRSSRGCCRTLVVYDLGTIVDAIADPEALENFQHVQSVVIKYGISSQRNAANMRKCLAAFSGTLQMRHIDACYTDTDKNRRWIDPDIFGCPRVFVHDVHWNITRRITQNDHKLIKMLHQKDALNILRVRLVSLNPATRDELVALLSSNRLRAKKVYVSVVADMVDCEVINAFSNVALQMFTLNMLSDHEADYIWDLHHPFVVGHEITFSPPERVSRAFLNAVMRSHSVSSSHAILTQADIDVLSGPSNVSSLTTRSAALAAALGANANRSLKHITVKPLTPACTLEFINAIAHCSIETLELNVNHVCIDDGSSSSASGSLGTQLGNAISRLRSLRSLRLTEKLTTEDREFLRHVEGVVGDLMV